MGPSSQGVNRFCFARTHFLACEDVVGGSQQGGGNVFFAKYSGPFGGSQLSGGRIIFFLPGRTSLHSKVSLVGPSGQGGESFCFARTHFLACEDVAGGSQQSGGRIVVFARTHFLACEDVASGFQ